MKKLLAIGLALTLLFSMGVVFAQEGDTGEVVYEDSSPITINKELTAQGVNPEETFNFEVGAGTVTDGSATSAPAFNPATFTIAVAQGALTGSANITLPDFAAVGVYTYPITETAGSTAGFNYDSGTYYLRVTVINDGQGGFTRILTLLGEDEEGKNVKVNAFENTFNSGSLVINKEITGNYAVYTDEFEVTVKLTPGAGKAIKKGPITISGHVQNKTSSVSDPDTNGVVTVKFWVTDDSTVTIANIPYDVTYVVTEESGEYTGTITDNDGGVIDGLTQSVDIVNNLDTAIAVGVNLDNLPYILTLIFAAGGLLVFAMRKRFAS